MTVLKLVHYKDLLKCNHGGTVNLNPTEERNTEIQEDLRVVTDKDLLERVIIDNCPKKCNKITSVIVGLAKDVELKAGAIPVLRNLQAVTDQQGVVTWCGFELDIDAAVKHLDDNAKQHSKPPYMCARYVANAIQKGGGLNQLEGADAKDLGGNLEKVGFEPAASNAIPQKGDVVVFDAVLPDHKYGHTAMWDGKQWVSDFKQPDILVSSAYKDKPYVMYRFKGGGHQAHAEPK